jgi:D-sedoheptulose 7-phosphate isomerase
MHMNESSWLDTYLERYREILASKDIFPELLKAKEIIVAAQTEKKKLMFSGNGASASIAAHLAVDFTKQGGVRAMTFNEPNLITAFANDFGYEKWVQEAIRFYGEPGDVAVLISSSGKSPNMLAAAKFATSQGIKVITLTGFEADNPLKVLGDVNLWVESRGYNIIECTHMIWLTAICDLIIGRAEYPVS